MLKEECHTLNIYKLIEEELAFQKKKYGVQSHSLEKWSDIINGEARELLLDAARMDEEMFKKNLVSVAALAINCYGGLK